MQKAFSLVELSIVLVILGLLTGGILAGQSLIRAAELRSVTADLTRYSTAVRTFQDKYFALPGDMNNATRFWGSAGGTGSDATCMALATTPATCNGNRDGWIETAVISADERFLAWEHLANAGLVEGSYTGRDGSATQGDGFDPNHNLLGTNVPRSKISNAGFILAAIASAQSGHPQYFDGSYGVNLLSLIGIGGQPLRPEEAWNIDTKLDDGRPAFGRVFNLKSSSTWQPGCSTTAVASTAEYALTNSSKLCILYITLQ